MWTKKGHATGQKKPFRLEDIWRIRTRLEIENNTEQLALLNLAIDSKLRSCDLLRMQVRHICSGGVIHDRVLYRQSKTDRDVQFQITSRTDQYGHHIGDLVLEHVADILRRYSPDTEFIGRWGGGGEELIILYCETPACSTLQYVENLRKQIELSPMVKGSSAIYVTASFGVASGLVRDGLQSLYERADSALYVAKNNGRNCVKVFSTVPIIQPE